MAVRPRALEGVDVTPSLAFGGVYAGRRVLLTGHTGFKGAWMATWLASLGAEVHGYALDAPTTPCLFAEADVEGGCASHRIGDVRDFPHLLATVERVRPEMVFHLAAQALVRESYAAPRETFDVNLMGTVNVLEAVRQAGGVRVVQVVTSDKCYENHEWAYAYRESDAMGGRDPYSASKGCAEIATAAYRRSFFSADPASAGGTGSAESTDSSVSVSTARAGNVIGGGDWAADRIVPDCIAALTRGEPVIVRNPDAVRPWQHVLEPLSGYLHLAACQLREPGRWDEAWNFGPAPASAVTVGRLVERVHLAWGRSVDAAHSTDRAPHEARFLRLDATKAQTQLGWLPAMDLDRTVAETVAWYRERAERGAEFDARASCLRQIESYTALAADAGAAWAVDVSADDRNRSTEAGRAAETGRSADDGTTELIQVVRTGENREAAR
ncbi:MAG: CDP-glucose 4,6-dehydratase [Gemmatimonadetes bacterium]|nr:CDP-glucose 4,6-dehydratase [Gemmatimonadota bacterium]